MAGDGQGPEGLPGGDHLEGLDHPGHGLVLQARVLALRLLPDHHQVYRVGGRAGGGWEGGCVIKMRMFR